MNQFPKFRIPAGMMIAHDWANRRVLVPATTGGQPNVPWSNGRTIQDVRTGRELKETMVDQSIHWVTEEEQARMLDADPKALIPAYRV